MSLFDEIKKVITEAGLILNPPPDPEQPLASCPTHTCEGVCMNCIILGCKSDGCQSGGCRSRTKVGEEFEIEDPGPEAQ